MTVNLPMINSSGLGVGVYYVRVILKASDGGAIPGHTAQASFLVGISVSASVSASAPIVAPGTSSVTTTIRVAGDNSVGPPSGTNANAIELYFTRFGANPNVEKVQVTYDGNKLTLGTPVPVTNSVPSDGILFSPDGHVVVANGPVSFINPLTGTYTSVDGHGAEHMASIPAARRFGPHRSPGRSWRSLSTQSPTGSSTR